MNALREAIGSVAIGEPTRVHNLTVFPLVVASPLTAEYLTFPEGRARGTTSITEVSEGGSVPELRVVNDAEQAVLLLDGEELIGAKQNRIVNLTILVAGRSRLTIPVSCVEAGRWAARSREFADSPDAMFAAARARKLDDVSDALASSGRRHTDQSAVWRDVAEKSRRVGSTSATNAMSDVFMHHRARIEDYTAAIVPVDRQVGAVFVIDGAVRGLELFDAPSTLATYLPKLVRSWALDALEGERNGSPGPDADAVRRAIDDLLAASPRRYPAVGLGEDVRLSGARVRGAALEVDARVVHLAAFWNGDNGGGGRDDRAAGSRALFTRFSREGVTDARMGPWIDHVPPPLAEEGRWDHVEGMLLGLAIGDALGNCAEGMTPAARRLRHGEIRDYLPNHHAGGARVGLPSDDSQMAFWTLEQLLEDGALVPERLADRFTRDQIFGIGSTVRAFLGAYKDDRLPWYRAGQRSAGNGALMRIAPILVPHVGRPSPALWSDAAVAGMVTHNDPASIGACVGFVRALWGALAMRTVPPRGWWVETVCSVMRQVEGETQYESRAPHLSYEGPVWRFAEEQVTRALQADLPADVACDHWYSGAYLLETVPSVLYILERHAADPEEAIVRAVNDTRDNDTVGAIVGAAVGALHGKRALPERWLRDLLGRTGADDDGRVFGLIEEARGRWGEGQ